MVTRDEAGTIANNRAGFSPLRWIIATATMATTAVDLAGGDVPALGPPTCSLILSPCHSEKMLHPIYAFVDDLFFLAKIQETARKLNVKVEFVKTEGDLQEKLKGNGDEKPSLIIFDLNNANAKPLTLIPKLKSKLKKGTSIIGFLSHVQGDLKQKAHDVGCDMVLPRSAFPRTCPTCCAGMALRKRS